MISSNQNGNTAVFLIVDGQERLLPEQPPQPEPNQPLPRVRQLHVPIDGPPVAVAPPTERPTSHTTPAPTLDEFLNRWRRGRTGLKRSTEAKLDHYLTMTRRYVDTLRPVTDYKPQDLRDALAQARADRLRRDDAGSDGDDRPRLKGQTINESIWRPLKYAFDLAVEEGCLAKNPMEAVKREKSVPINRQQLTWEDALRILEDAKARAPESYLELKFMLLLGVGQAEAKVCAGGSVDPARNKITFTRGKTGKEFTVPLHPWAKAFVHSELEPRLRPGEPVFCWRNPRKTLETSCRNLSVSHVDIRSLRRTLIVNLLEQGVEPRVVASWQGHADARLILDRYGAQINQHHEQRELAKLSGQAG